MRKTFLLILPGAMLAAMLAVGVGAQSGRKIVRPTQPAPPIQAPVFTPPEPEPEREPVAPATLTVVPDRLLKRQLRSLDNGSFSLADFGGKVLVINLWASWCGPCRREVPDYEKVRKEFAGREVEFIGLTTEDPRTDSQRVRQFVRDFHFGFRLGWADRETAITLMNGRDSVPQTLVIAADGRVISHWTGYNPRQSGDRLRDMLKSALAESVGSGRWAARN